MAKRFQFFDTVLNLWKAEELPPGPITPVQAVKTDTFSYGGTSWTPITGLSVAYTPLSTSQKVLVRAVINVGHGGNVGCALRICRDGAVLVQGDVDSTRTRAHASSYLNQVANQYTIPIEFLDTPGTTSAVTYTAEIITSNTASLVVWVNRSGTDSASSLFYYRTASTLTIQPY